MYMYTSLRNNINYFIAEETHKTRMWFFLVPNLYCVISNLRIVKKVKVMAEALKHSPWCFPATNEA